MNREIKFRAWVKDNAMVYGVSLMANDNTVCYFGKGNIIGCISMQYVGRKDKNDKEVYEGDWIRIKDSEEYWLGGKKIIEDFIGEVYWNEKDYCYLLKRQFHRGYRQDWCKGSSDSWLWRDLEVIGNIYENPELLNAE